LTKEHFYRQSNLASGTPAAPSGLDLWLPDAGLKASAKYV
jgi:hypothetical protein